MSQFGDDMAKTAVEMIDELGTDMQFELPAGETTDVGTGHRGAPGSPTILTRRATPPEEFKLWEIDGVGILSGDVRFYLAGRGLGFEPKRGVVVTHAGKRYSIESRRATWVDGEVALWEVQGRP